MKDLIKQLAGNSNHVGYYKSLIFDVTKLIRLTDCSPKEFNIIYNYLVQLAKDNNNFKDNGEPNIVGINGDDSYTKTSQEIAVEEFYNRMEKSDWFPMSDVYDILGRDSIEANHIQMYHEDLF